jgi:hypothetical protein
MIKQNKQKKNFLDIYLDSKRLISSKACLNNEENKDAFDELPFANSPEEPDQEENKENKDKENKDAFDELPFANLPEESEQEESDEELESDQEESDEELESEQEESDEELESEQEDESEFLYGSDTETVKNFIEEPSENSNRDDSSTSGSNSSTTSHGDPFYLQGFLTNFQAQQNPSDSG